MITKCPEKSKKITGMMEWWNEGCWSDGVLVKSTAFASG
jgi:hypothetical protein